MAIIRKKRGIAVLAAVCLVLLTATACAAGKPVTDASRELPFENITKEPQPWVAETCRLIVENETASVSGRVRNTGAWPTSGLTMYLNFLDSSGNVLTSAGCQTVLDEAVPSNGTAGYTVVLRNFFAFDEIASATIEFGK